MSFLDTCAPIPDHIEDNCNAGKMGGFPSFAIVDVDSTVVGDWANSTQWLAEIALGKIRVANRVKFNIPDPAPVKSDNLVACGSQQILDAFDWTLEGVDGNVSTYNDDFYTALNNNEKYVVMWNADETEIVVINKKTSFTVTKIFPASNRERQHYKITGEWASDKDWFPTSYTEPTGVFSL